jgi:hypothetical protein
MTIRLQAFQRVRPNMRPMVTAKRVEFVSNDVERVLKRGFGLCVLSIGGVHNALDRVGHLPDAFEKLRQVSQSHSVMRDQRML